jgi:hypothetical protein
LQAPFSDGLIEVATSDRSPSFRRLAIIFDWAGRVKIERSILTIKWDFDNNASQNSQRDRSLRRVNSQECRISQTVQKAVDHDINLCLTKANGILDIRTVGHSLGSLPAQ